MYDSKNKNEECSSNLKGDCIKDRGYFKTENYGYVSAKNSYIPIESLIADLNNNYLN